MKTKTYPTRRGMKILTRPIKRKIGSWVEMEYDAKIKRLGMTWLRVKGGFGGRGDREDWVGDVPFGCISVSNYNWTEHNFGHYGTFDKAIIGETRLALENLESEIKKLAGKTAQARHCLTLLKSALGFVSGVMEAKRVLKLK